MVPSNDWRVKELRAAAHMLHEQAHGPTPWRTCQEDPCRHLWASRSAGPAQVTMLAGGRFR